MVIRIGDHWEFRPRHILFLLAIAVAIRLGPDAIRSHQWGCASVQRSAAITSWPGSGLNPVERSKRVEFQLLGAQSVGVQVYDIAGRLQWHRDAYILPAGRHEFVWNARTDAGREVGAGVYTAVFDFGEQLTRKKCLVVGG